MRKKLYIIVTVLLLAAMAGTAVACRKHDFDAQNVRYGQYGPMHVLGNVRADGDLDIDGTTNLDDLDVDASGEIEIDGGLTDFGGGSCGVADGDNDVCIQGVLEVDTELELDGTLDADSTSDFAGTATFSKGSGNAIVISAGGTLEMPATADISLDGYMNIGDGTPNGSVTAGTNEQLYVEGAFEVDGEAEFDGAIDADGTSNFAGTMTLQGLLLTSATDLTVSDSDTITPTTTMISLDTAGPVTVTLNAAGTEGQLLILVNDDGNAVIIADTNIASSDGDVITLAGADDCVVFIYQDNVWHELLLIADS